ncbi:MAG: hypothetical protein WAU96_01235 [Anaerolineae bacterium]|nr:hypothetical protein [Thermoflexales bacterium]
MSILSTMVVQLITDATRYTSGMQKARDDAQSALGRIGSAVDTLANKEGVMGSFFKGIQNGMAQARSEMDKTSDAAKKSGQAHGEFSNRLDSLAGTINGKVIGALAALAAGAGGVLSIKEAVKAAVEYGDQLDSLGDVLGTTANESAALNFAITSAGGNTQQLSSQLTFLVKGLTNSKGELGSTGKALQEIGVSAFEVGKKYTATIPPTQKQVAETEKLQKKLEKARARYNDLGYAITHNKKVTESQRVSYKQLGEEIAAMEGKLSSSAKTVTKTFITQGPLKDTSKLLTEIAQKLSDMPDGLEKSELMMKLFGRSGKDLSDVMNALANGGLSEATKKAAALGLMIGEDGVAKTVKFKQSWALLGLVFQGFKVQVGQAVLPTLQTVLGGIVEFASVNLPKAAGLIQNGMARVEEGMSAFKAAKSLGMSDAQAFQNAIRVMFGADAAKAIQPILNVAGKVKEGIEAFIGAKNLKMSDAQAFQNAIRVMFGADAAKDFQALIPKFDNLKTSAEGAAGSVIHLVEVLLNKGGSAAQGGGAQKPGGLIGAFMDDLNVFLLQVPGFMQEIEDLIINPEKKINTMLDDLGQKFSATWTKRNDDLTIWLNGLGKELDAKIDDLNKTISTTWTNLWASAGNVISKALGDAKAEFEKKVNEFESLAGQIVQKLITTFENKRAEIINKLLSIVSGAIDAIKKALGISDSSAQAQDAGRNAAQGFIKGYRSAIGPITDSAVDRLGANVNNAARTNKNNADKTPIDIVVHNEMWGQAVSQNIIKLVFDEVEGGKLRYG